MLVGTAAGVAHVRASRDGLQSAETLVTVKPQVPLLLIPIVAGETTVGGAAEPGASVQVFVNGALRGGAIVAGNGAWQTPSFLAPVAAGDVVTAQQTVAGVASGLSPPAVVVAMQDAGALDGVTESKQIIPFILSRIALTLGAGTDKLMLAALVAAALGSGAAILRAMTSALASTLPGRQWQRQAACCFSPPAL